MSPSFSSIDFLPDNLQGRELHQHLAPLLDWALEYSQTSEVWELDPLISELGLEYKDPEAVNAYFNKFVQPAIGTRDVLRFIFGILGVDAQVIEWFEEEIPTPPFKITVQFEEYPGYLDFDKLIGLIYAVKNERTRLSTIRMVGCPGMFILDYGVLDRNILDTAEGYLNPEGVLICLHQDYSQVVPAIEGQDPISFATGIRTVTYDHDIYFRLDFMNLDDEWSISDNSIIGTRGAITSRIWQYFSPKERCISVEEDLPYCPLSEVDVAPYHSVTFASEQILSDDGCTLDDGTGFFGYEEILEGSLVLDEFILGDPTLVMTPIYEFEFPLRARESLDMEFRPVISSRATGYHAQTIDTLWFSPFEHLDGYSTIVAVKTSSGAQYIPAETSWPETSWTGWGYSWPDNDWSSPRPAPPAQFKTDVYTQEFVKENTTPLAHVLSVAAQRVPVELPRLGVGTVSHRTQVIGFSQMKPKRSWRQYPYWREVKWVEDLYPPPYATSSSTRAQVSSNPISWTGNSSSVRAAVVNANSMTIGFGRLAIAALHHSAQDQYSDKLWSFESSWPESAWLNPEPYPARSIHRSEDAPL